MKKSIINISAVVDKTTAHIKITDRISELSESSSANTIKQIVSDLLKQGIKQADVYINSEGGSVFQATEIANELKQFEKVNLTVGALAASAATYIVAKFNTSAYSNSQFMIHKPKLSTFGNENAVEADLKLLKNLTEDYKNTYAHKTKKTPEEIEALWNKGDYWMTANEALEMGLIDQILPEKQNISAESIAILEACGAPHIPEKQNETNIKMDRNQLIASLGLDKDATDEQINSAIATYKEKANQADRMKVNSEHDKKEKAKTLVKDAIRLKKINANQESEYLQLAESNYGATEKILAAMSSIPKLSDQITHPSEGVDASKQNWTLSDYLDKDPQALAVLETANPELFRQLNETHYQSKFK